MGKFIAFCLFLWPFYLVKWIIEATAGITSYRANKRIVSGKLDREE